MTDKKLTDKEIVKALSICSNENGICSECPYSDDYTNCNTRIAKDALDLITRQQAEIERLKKEIAKEVKHGQWIEDGNGVQVCSECGEEHEWQDFRAPYCDMCGAKMDKK